MIWLIYQTQKSVWQNFYYRNLSPIRNWWISRFLLPDYRKCLKNRGIYSVYMLLGIFIVNVENFCQFFRRPRKIRSSTRARETMADLARFTLYTARYTIIHARILKTRIEGGVGRQSGEKRTLAREVGHVDGDKKLRARSESYDFSAARARANAGEGVQFMWQLSPGTKCGEIRILYIAP